VKKNRSPQKIKSNACICTMNSNISRQHLCLVSRYTFKRCDVSLENFIVYITLCEISGHITRENRPQTSSTSSSVTVTMTRVKTENVLCKHDNRSLTKLVFRAGNISSARWIIILGTLVARDWSIVRNREEMCSIMTLVMVLPNSEEIVTSLIYL